MPIIVRGRSGIEPAADTWEYDGWGDPSALGLKAGVGSTYVQLDSSPPGDFWSKTGANDTDWTLQLTLPAAVPGTVLSTDVQAALGGTTGAPSATNKYVTDSDARLNGTLNGAVAALGQSRTVTTGSPYLANQAVFNVKDYGAVGDGVTDDTAAIQAAVTAAAAATGKQRVWFPAGSYKVTKVSGQPYAVNLASNLTLSGVPGQSIIKNTGLDPADSSKDYAALYGSAVHDLVIEDLAFSGENTPFVYYGNRQMSCVFFPVSTPVQTDCMVRRCTFDNQYGFTVHLEGNGTRVHTVDCVMRNCANGLNNNSSYSQQTGNVMFNAEAIETAGAYNVVSGNTLSYDASFAGGNGGISIGGATGPGTVLPGVVCSGNVVQNSPAQGINVSDGIVDSVVSGNTVIASALNGIQIADGGFNATARIQVVGNTIMDAGLSTGIAATRVGLYVKRNDHGLIANNVVNYGVTAGQDTFFGLLLGSTTTDLTIHANTLRASNTGISCGGGVTLTNLALLQNIITAPTPVTLAAATAVTYVVPPVQPAATTVAYGVNMTVDCNKGDVFLVTVTNALAFNFLIPVNHPVPGATQRITLQIKNGTAGTIADGTFTSSAGGYLLNRPFLSPATGLTTSINFAYDSVQNKWVETGRTENGTFPSLAAAGGLTVGGTTSGTTATYSGGISGLSVTAPTVTASTTLVASGGAVTLNSATTNSVQSVDGTGNVAKDIATYASTHRLFAGLKGSSPTEALDVDGSAVTALVPIVANGGVQGQISVRSVTANTTLTTTDQLLKVDATAGGVVVTVPVASTGRYAWTIMRTDSTSGNNVTVAVTSGSGDTVVGTATIPVGGWADVAIDATGHVYVLQPGGAATSIAAANVTAGSFANGAYTFPNTLNITGGTGLVVASGVNATFNAGAGIYGPVVYLPTNRGNSSGVTNLASIGGPVQMVTLNGNWAPTGLGSGAGLVMDLYLVQDATGGHTVTWPAGTKVASDVSIATAANAWTAVRIMGFGNPATVVVTQLGTGT